MVALSELSILCWSFGGGKGLEHRQEVGEWELCHLVRNNDGTVSILSPNKDWWLSIELNGSLGERPASNPPGHWEKFTLDGNVLTELPKEGITRPLKRFADLS